MVVGPTETNDPLQYNELLSESDFFIFSLRSHRQFDSGRSDPEKLALTHIPKAGDPHDRGLTSRPRTNNARWVLELEGLRDGDLSKQFASMIKEGKVPWGELFEYASQSAPEASRASLLSILAEAAAREGNIDVLRYFLEMNPGRTKGAAILSYARNVNGVYHARLLIECLRDSNALPEEVDAMSEGLLGPLQNLGQRDLESLAAIDKLSKTFASSIGSTYGSLLCGQTPNDALGSINKLPEELKDSAQTSYWVATANADLELVKGNWSNETIPEKIRSVVGKAVLNAIVGRQTREDALDFALAAGSERLVKELSR